MTGIPLHEQDRNVPWARPEFVPRPSTRSSTSSFEVSIFENGESIFIVPLELYKWRLQNLESAITEKGDASGIELTDFYVNAESEDSKFDPFSCEMLSTSVDEARELHFQGSGYNSVHIQYESSDDGNLANAWDVTVRGTEKSCPLPARLTDAQTEAVVEILDSLESDVYVQATFSAPVDTRCFVDYLMMIEVPMDISTIRRRLQQQYYTNVYSVLADVKLIRDNCLKYNKMGSEISNEALKLLETFSNLFEQKLSAIGYEPCERERSTEMEDAVDAIASRRSSRLRGSQSAPSENNGLPHASLNDPNDANNNQGTARRSLRASQRSARANVQAVEEVPRLRISIRQARQEEYISEEEESGIEEESDAESAASNFKVLIGGEEVAGSSDSESDVSTEEAPIVTRQKRRATKQDISSSGDDEESEHEEAVGRGRRQSGRVAAKKRGLKNPPEDDASTYSSDVEEPPVAPRGGSRQSSRQTARRLAIPENKEESSEVESEEERSSSDEAVVFASIRTRRSVQPSTIPVPSPPLQSSRRSRSSPRRRLGLQNDIAPASLQETFTERRSTSNNATTRSTRSRHVEPTASEPEESTLARNRGSRSTRVHTSTLENLPHSPSSPGAARSSSRRRTNATNYQDYSNSDHEKDESDSEEERPTRAGRSMGKRSRPAATKSRKYVVWCTRYLYSILQRSQLQSTLSIA